MSSAGLEPNVSAERLRTLDLSRWAVVGYNDDTGIGRMAQDITALLGVRQLVVPSDRLQTKPLRPGLDTLLPLDADEQAVAGLLTGLQGIIILEAWWNPALALVARRLEVRVACVPMWEWFRGTDAHWAMVDLFLCPSHLALTVVRRYGWTNAIHLPWALDLSRLPPREVTGPGRVFFHNAGLVDHDDRKGTRETVRAFSMVRSRDVRLIVRLQKPADMGPLDDRIEVRVENLDRVGALYADGDVAVQPSSMEGVGFMVLEPVCCGIPTITLDYPPMSDHVRQGEMLVRKRWFKRAAFPARAAHIRHAHRRVPSVRDLTRKIEWCAAADLRPISQANRAFAEATFEPTRLRAAWAQALEALL
jgi:glycosyltransferase involved in cell wall biosynthesis